MRNDLAFEIVGLVGTEDVVVPLGRGALGCIAICPVLIDLADVGECGWRRDGSGG